MSRKKHPASGAGTYALCITIGVILGIGLTPLTGNFAVMVLAGAAAGALAGLLINRRAPTSERRRHH